MYETLWEKWDLYVAFIERGFRLLRKNGTLTMIVSDAYSHAKYAQKSQQWFLDNARILRLDFLSEIKIFDASVRNIVFFFQRDEAINHEPMRRIHRGSFGKVQKLGTGLQKKADTRLFFPENRTAYPWNAKTVELSSICYLSVGMVVHAHEKKAKGAFELKDLVRDNEDQIHSRQFVEGKHVGRWTLKDHRWIEWGTDRAPSLFRRPTFPELYDSTDKLFIHRTGGEHIRVAHAPPGILCNHTIIVAVAWAGLRNVTNGSLRKAARYSFEKRGRRDLIAREQLELNSERYSFLFLLGLMNSRFTRGFLRKNRRSNTDLYPEDWKKLPIPDVPTEDQQPVVDLVERILTTKKSNPTADVSALESEIDQLVYQLYDLTPEEIAIVEESTAAGSQNTQTAPHHTAAKKPLKKKTTPDLPPSLPGWD